MATAMPGVLHRPCPPLDSFRTTSLLGTSRTRQSRSYATRSTTFLRNRTCSTRIVRRRLSCIAEIGSMESRAVHPDTILTCVSKDAEVPSRSICTASMCIRPPTLFSGAPLSAGFCVRGGRHGPRFGGPETPRHCAHSRTHATAYSTAPADVWKWSDEQATAALGRLLMGTLLLGALKGWEETVQVSSTASIMIRPASLSD